MELCFLVDLDAIAFLHQKCILTFLGGSGDDGKGLRQSTAPFWRLGVFLSPPPYGTREPMFPEPRAC